MGEYGMQGNIVGTEGGQFELVVVLLASQTAHLDSYFSKCEEYREFSTVVYKIF
jgi:hypothetical protein